MPENDTNHLVFPDESGINTNMTRHVTPIQNRMSGPWCYALLNTLRSTTILLSIRLDGKTVHTVYGGGTTAEYLNDCLLPSLSGDDTIVMDNMRAHHAKAVKKIGIR